jgi:hypothetical protein
MPTDIKFVLIATGIEADFTELADNRARELVAAINKTKSTATSLVTPPAIVRFIHFAFQNRAVQVAEHAFPEKGSKPFQRAQWKDIAHFQPSEGDAAFDPKTFVDQSVHDDAGADLLPPPKPAHLSITNLYHSVRGAPPGSVLEVSIFSHGWVSGPVLVNTFDSEETLDVNGVTFLMRTDTDFDGRDRTDFLPHMGEDPTKDSSADKIKSGGKDALAQFVAAFTPEKGTFRVFGCNVQDKIVFVGTDGIPEDNLRQSTVFQVLHQAFGRHLRSGETSALVKKLRKGDSPDGALTLDMGQEFVNEAQRDALQPPNHHTHDPIHTAAELLPIHYSIDASFFQLSTDKVLARTWEEILSFVARRTKIVYAFKAGVAFGQTGVSSHGAVPGTGGDFFRDEELKLTMMNVPTRDWGDNIRFFKIYMGVPPDEFNYGIFDKRSVAAIDALDK